MIFRIKQMWVSCNLFEVRSAWNVVASRAPEDACALRLRFMKDGDWDAFSADVALKSRQLVYEEKDTVRTLSKKWFIRVMYSFGVKDKKANKCWKACKDETGGPLKDVIC